MAAAASVCAVQAIARTFAWRGDPAMHLSAAPCMAVYASKRLAANRSPCCAAMPAVLASPRFQGVPADFRTVPGNRNSLLDSNSLRRLPRRRRGCERSKATSVSVAGEDPIISGMAGRYATALFELALDNKAVDAVKKDLAAPISLASSAAPYSAPMNNSRHSRRFSPKPASLGWPQISSVS
jgi:hypothetical protein